MQDFTFNGFVVSIERRTLGNRLEGRRAYSFFSAYNPTTKQSIKGQGGKLKVKEIIGKL